MSYYSKADRLKEVFLSDIDGERFMRDKYIPSAQHLAELYSASRNTVRRMLGQLVEEGILERCSNNRLLRSKGCSVVTMSETAADVLEKPIVLGWFYSGSSDRDVVDRSRGIERYVRENRLELRIFSSVRSHEPILNLLENITNCGVDGVIVAHHPQERYIAAINQVADMNFPVVIACGQSESCRASLVAGDEFSGIYSLTNLLLQKYDHPPYFIGVPGNIELRIAAFRQAMTDAGFVKQIDDRIFLLKPELDAPENWGMRQKLLLPGKLLRPCLSRMKLPASIVCANDYIAFGVYEAATELGLKVGRDLAVTGFDDLPFAARMNPPLTTVRTDCVQLGYQSAWLLDQLIRRRFKCAQRLLVPSELIIRSSC